MSADEDTESAQAVDEFCAVQISEYITFVFPFNERGIS